MPSRAIKGLLGWGTYDSQDFFKGAENAPGYSNRSVDELIEGLTITYTRDAMIEEICKAVLDEVVHIPLHQ